MTGRVVQGEGGPRYTPREKEVLNLLARGRSVREIANQLGTSTRTVRTYLENIRRKGGFSGL